MQQDIVAVSKRIVNSLTFRCVSCIGLYACAIAIVFVAARGYSQRILSASSISMEMLMEQEDVLAHDRFDALANLVIAPNEVIVYNENGSCLYASTSEIAQRVPYEELSVVATSAQENEYYEVIEHPASKKDDSDVIYEIMLLIYDEDTQTSKVLDRCVCDNKLRIIEGDLFHGTQSLTVEEFALIRGEYGRNMQVEKYEYETVDGERRTMVLASPKQSEKVYRELLDKSEKVWPVAVVLSFVLTCAVVLVIFRIIRGSMRPLESAIHARREGTDCQLQEDDLPVELRDTYRSFVDLMDVLNSAHEENQTIIADVSHDLKTPLAVIGGYAQAFEDGCVPEDKRSAYLHAIYEKSRSASQLLDSLLTISRLNHPALEPSFVRSDVCEQVRVSVIAASAEVELAGNTLEADVEDDPLWCNLDKTLFNRVMENLISNACRHNAPGIRILVQCHKKSGAARVSVADDGVGFSPELKERAFEPFVTKNVARESGKGSGLGLAIAKKCIQIHGGSIRLGDTPPASYTTEVIMELPLETADPGVNVECLR